MPRKTRTFDQIESMQDKAVRFLHDVVGDPDRAEEFEAMSPEEYAEHKRIEIVNPTARARRRTITMRRPTYAELKDRVSELEDENQALNEKLDSILDIASSEEEEDDEEEDDEEDLE